MYLIVCYDVTTNRRRTKLHKALSGFLDPVQKSVFEGDLPSARYETLRAAIEKTIDQEKDTVRIYHLSNACRSATELIGCSVTVQGDQDVVV